MAHTVDVSQPATRVARFTTPLPPEKMKKGKTDYADQIMNHAPSTKIIDIIKKKAEKERIFELEITPGMALDLLTLNDWGQNRNLNEKKIDQYTKDMKSKNFMYVGDPVRFSISWKLIDGQHRLLSCYLSGVAVKFLFICELPESAFAHIDMGKNRSAADTIAIAGFKTNQTQLAYAVKNVLLFQYYSRLGSMVSNHLIPNHMVAKFTKSTKHMSELNDMLGKAQASWGKEVKWFTNGQWATLAYILRNLEWSSDNKQKRVLKFIDSLVEGADLRRDSPIFQLRKILEKWDDEQKSKSRKIPNNTFTLKAKYFFLAWNRYITNEKSSELKLDETDKTTPQIRKPKAA